MVKVYFSSVEEGRQLPYEGVLNEAEKMRVRRLKNKEDQEVYKVSTFLKGAIGDVECGDGWRGRLGQNQYGKPYIDGSSIAFNFSQTDRYVFCGVLTGVDKSTGVEIGVDAVDLETERIVFDSFKSGVFTEAEMNWIGQDNKRLFISWALKEAYLKAIGTGLKGDLRDIEFKQKDEYIQVYFQGKLLEHAFAHLFLFEKHTVIAVVTLNAGLEALSTVTGLNVSPLTPTTRDQSLFLQTAKPFQFEHAGYLFNC